MGDPLLHRDAPALSRVTGEIGKAGSGTTIRRPARARASVTSRRRGASARAVAGALSLAMSRAPLVAVAAFAVVASTVAARPLDDVVDSGLITVFAYSDHAPYSWRDESGAHGIDVEIGRAFGEALGVEVEFLIRGADENVDDDLRVNIWKGDLINRRAADVMMHVPVDAEVDARNELAVITGPYFQEQMALLHDTDTLPEVPSFGRFVTTPIAVELDTAGDFFLSNAFRGQIRESVVRGRTFEAAAELWLSGEAPALLASRAQAEWVARAGEERGLDAALAFPPMPGIVRTGWPIGIAVKHDSRDLGYALGDVLSALIDSGEMQDIYARHGVTWIAPELR